MTIQATEARPTIAHAPGRRLLQSLRDHPTAVRAASVVVFFAIWEATARGAHPLFVVPPSEVLDAAVELFRNGQLYAMVMESMSHFLIGTTVSIVAGILIGVAIGLWWQAEYVLDPFINGFYAVPKPALVPLYILWFGLETEAKVAMIVSIAIFPVIINTYSGIKDTRGSMLDVGRAYCATEWQIFWKIILPGATPYIMSGIRLAVGLAIIGMIVAEFFTAMVGLGGAIREAGDNFDTAIMYFGILLVGALGVALNEVVAFVERRLSRWRVLEKERAQS